MNLEEEEENKRKQRKNDSSPDFVPGDDLIWSFVAAASC
jgi:hypothetical protein